MSTTLSRIIRMGISAVIAGMMGTGTILLSNMTAEGHLKPGSLLIAIISGVMLALKDMQAFLSTPPTIEEQTR